MRAQVSRGPPRQAAQDGAAGVSQPAFEKTSAHVIPSAPGTGRVYKSNHTCRDQLHRHQLIQWQFLQFLCCFQWLNSSYRTSVQHHLRKQSSTWCNIWKYFRRQKLNKCIMQCALRLLTRTTQIFSQHWAVELSAINISKWTSLTGRTGIQSFLLRLNVLIESWLHDQRFTKWILSCRA